MVRQAARQGRHSRVPHTAHAVLGRAAGFGSQGTAAPCLARQRLSPKTLACMQHNAMACKPLNALAHLAALQRHLGRAGTAQLDSAVSAGRWQGEEVVPASKMPVGQPSKMQVGQPSSKMQVGQPSSKMQVGQPSSKMPVGQPSSKMQVGQPSSKMQVGQPSSKVKEGRTGSAFTQKQFTTLEKQFAPTGRVTNSPDTLSIRNLHVCELLDLHSRPACPASRRLGQTGPAGWHAANLGCRVSANIGEGGEVELGQWVLEERQAVRL